MNQSLPPPPPRPQPSEPLRMGGGALVPLAALIGVLACWLVALAVIFGL